MLANNSDASAQSGNLSKDVHLPATSRYELLDFIANELPKWRDRNDRKNHTSETSLTSQLCAHLNSAARHSQGWDLLQFRIEEPDEQQKGRKIDLVPAPCGAAMWIEGRRHTDFDTLLPIECKRLPTPDDKDRDNREYVFSQKSTTGGIQRFKAGHHGKGHKLGAMIAYMQKETASEWHKRIGSWIGKIIESKQAGWTVKDLLNLDRDDQKIQMAVLHSFHKREQNLPDIELRHLWIKMNQYAEPKCG